MNTDAILTHFDLEHQPPTTDFLKSLITAYTRTVPWGSVFRLARFARYETPTKRARFADAFWDDVLHLGGDGTCFESNYAFAALLRDLGYTLDLTINNMEESIGCHSALIVHLDQERWLVDVGLPIHVPLRIDREADAVTEGPFHTYTMIPLENNRYNIHRTGHPNPYCFTLIDKPISDTDYEARLIRDHQDDGLFLDKVILRVVHQGAQWRFNGRDDVVQFEVFTRDEKQTHPITAPLVDALPPIFNVDRDVLAEAVAAQREHKSK